jgi:hypothetical protein
MSRIGNFMKGLSVFYHKGAKVVQGRLRPSIVGYGSLKADFQSSHEAPRSSLRVLASN